MHVDLGAGEDRNTNRPWPGASCPGTLQAMTRRTWLACWPWLMTPDVVEAALAAGRLPCPGCSGSLGPWSWAREREIRGSAGARRRLRPRRARCRGCGTTHVLLPIWTLVRRRDATQVIVTGLSAWLGGQGHRPVAVALGVPEGTVRGWVRRFAGRAELLRVHATPLAHHLDPLLPAIAARGSPCEDAWEALGVALAAAVRRFGPGGPPWHALAGLTGGALLSTGPLPTR